MNPIPENLYPSQKTNPIHSVLHDIFNLADPVKAEEDLNLFFSAGGSFHDITEYLNMAKSSDKLEKLTIFLDIIRRTIKLEQQYLQAIASSSAKKDKSSRTTTKDSHSSQELQKVSDLFQSHLKSEHNVKLLHMACQSGLIDLAAEVAKNSVDVNALNPQTGATALHAAAWNGNTELMSWLISKEANVNAATFKAEDGKTKAKFGKETPLHMAASQDNLDAIKLLLAHGADINAVNAEGKTPLHCAIEKGKVETIEFLLINKAQINAANNKGATPCHYACLTQRVDLIKLLLRYGADPLLVDSYGETPFQALQLHASKKVVKELFADFPVILDLLQKPIEQLLPKLRYEPNLLFVDPKEFPKKNPLEAVLLLGDKELAENMAILMPPELYKMALEALTKEYSVSALKLIIDAPYMIKKSFVYQISSKEEIPEVPPLELKLFMSLFKHVKLKFSPKLVNISPQDIIFDKKGNLNTHEKISFKKKKLKVNADEFTTVKTAELQFDSKGNMVVDGIATPYLIMKIGNKQFPVKIREENGVKKIQLNIDMLLPLFDRINFSEPAAPGYRNPDTIHDATGTLGPTREIVSVDQLKAGLKTFVKNINFRIPFTATPSEDKPAELEEWYAYVEAMVLNVIKKGLEEDIQAKAMKEKDPTPSAPSAITFGIAGKWCGTRFLDDSQFLYDTIMEIIRPLDLQILQVLSKLKLGIVETLIDKSDEHNVHQKSKILQLIDIDAGITEEEKKKKIYFRDDPYLPRMDQSQIVEAFWTAFTPTRLIDLIQEPFNKKTLFNEELVFQWFKDNTPQDWEKEKYDKIYEGLKKCQSAEEKAKDLKQYEIFIQLKDLKQPDKINWDLIIEEDRKFSFREKVLCDESGKYKRDAIFFLLSKLGVFETER